MKLKAFGLALALVSTMAQARVYTLGVENIDYYPIYKTDERDNYEGFARELFDKFAKEARVEFKYEPLPVARLTSDFVQGEVDFKFPDNEHWAGDAKKDVKVIYSKPVMSFTDGVMVTPAKKSKGVESLKVLGVVRGFTPWAYLGLVKEGKISLQETSNLNGTVNQALNDRIDGAFFNVDVAKYFMRHTMKQEDALVFDESLPHDTSTYHLSSISHPELVEAFDKFLIDNKDWVNQLKAKYEIRKD